MIRAISGILIMLIFTSVAAAQNAYKVRSGDVLTIEVLEDAGLNRTTLVLPDGSISFPLVGNLQASGRSVVQIKSDLSTGLASNFATTPNVFVSVSKLGERRARKSRTAAKISVFALGEFNNPGKSDVRANTTLLQFLAQTGGFTRFAATKRIQLRRSDPKTGKEQLFRFNFHAVERGAPLNRTIILREGDVIVVPERRLFE